MKILHFFRRVGYSLLGSAITCGKSVVNIPGFISIICMEVYRVAALVGGVRYSQRLRVRDEPIKGAV